MHAGQCHWSCNGFRLCIIDPSAVPIFGVEERLEISVIRADSFSLILRGDEFSVSTFVSWTWDMTI
ncbi:hypothetical protein T4C_481 [Trichinella pseudospiralis]|uniref:Uncharacterized protein n=1 Tax=Trichinella pseudospiralis TaxID=6337 RepID=A0A0V1KCA6_TRIPS|nr:hypothetical protein T4C_481 [Trichinella pseudospiralis]